MSTTVNLHENASPPSAADAQNQRRRPVSRNLQKRKNMPVVQASERQLHRDQRRRGRSGSG